MLILQKQKPFWFMVSSENNFTCCADNHFENRPCKLLLQIPCVNFHEGICNFHIFTFTSSHCKSLDSSAPSLSQMHPIKALSGGFISRDGKSKPGLKILWLFSIFQAIILLFWRLFMTFKCAYEWLSGGKKRKCGILEKYMSTQNSPSYARYSYA